MTPLDKPDRLGTGTGHEIRHHVSVSGHPLRVGVGLPGVTREPALPGMPGPPSPSLSDTSGGSLLELPHPSLSLSLDDSQPTRETQTQTRDQPPQTRDKDREHSVLDNPVLLWSVATQVIFLLSNAGISLVSQELYYSGSAGGLEWNGMDWIGKSNNSFLFPIPSLVCSKNPRF